MAAGSKAAGTRESQDAIDDRYLYFQPHVIQRCGADRYAAEEAFADLSNRAGRATALPQ